MCWTGAATPLASSRAADSPRSRLNATPCPLLVLLLRPDDDSLSMASVETALALGCASGEPRDWAVVDVREAAAGLAWLAGAALAAERPQTAVPPAPGPRASAAYSEALTSPRTSQGSRASRRMSGLTALLMGRD